MGRLHCDSVWEQRLGVYDVIYSIGAACGCALWLRKCHLRQHAGPLDWVKVDGGLSRRVELIETRFAGWLQDDNLELLGEDERTRIFRDDTLGITFIHDFPTSVTFPVALEKARQRYRHRQERFFTDIAQAKRTLLVWFSTQLQTQKREAIDVSKRLRATLGSTVELMIVEHEATIPCGSIFPDFPADGVSIFRLNLRTGKKNLDQDVLGDAPVAMRQLMSLVRLRPDLARRVFWFDIRREMIKFSRRLLACMVPCRTLRRKIRAQDRV